MSAVVSSWIVCVAWYILCNLTAFWTISAAMSMGFRIDATGKCLLYSSWRDGGGGVMLYLCVSIST